MATLLSGADLEAETVPSIGGMIVISGVTAALALDARNLAVVEPDDDAQPMRAPSLSLRGRKIGFGGTHSRCAPIDLRIRRWPCGQQGRSGGRAHAWRARVFGGGA